MWQNACPMRWIKYVFAFCLAGLGLASAMLYYDSYWRWRDCFNEEGRCFDPVSQNVYLEQAGLAWGVLAGLFLATALILLLFQRQ